MATFPIQYSEARPGQQQCDDIMMQGKPEGEQQELRSLLLSWPALKDAFYLFCNLPCFFHFINETGRTVIQL